MKPHYPTPAGSLAPDDLATMLVGNPGNTLIGQKVPKPYTIPGLYRGGGKRLPLSTIIAIAHHMLAKPAPQRGRHGEWGTELAKQHGVSRRTVLRWRARLKEILK